MAEPKRKRKRRPRSELTVDELIDQAVAGGPGPVDRSDPKFVVVLDNLPREPLEPEFMKRIVKMIEDAKAEGPTLRPIKLRVP